MFEEQNLENTEQVEIPAQEEIQPEPETEENFQEKEEIPYKNSSFSEETVLSLEQIEKKDIKRNAKIIGFSFLLMSVIIFSFSFLAVAIFNVLGFDYSKAYEILNEPAVAQVQQILFSIIIFTIPFIIVFKLCRYRISDLINFKKPEKNSFLPLFFVGLSICAFSNIASSIAGSIFENFGVDYEVTYSENPKGIFGFFLSLIATVIVPPLVEEFACRGIVLGILKKHGELFAIIVSAILFGFMHSNFEQIPFAFFVGLGLGFITIKSGSIWLAVLVHAVNNSISVIYSYFLSKLSLNFQNISYTVLLAVELILGIISLLYIKDNDFFKLEDSKTENTVPLKLKYFFTSVPIIIYLIFCVISSLKFFN